ncbi:3-deoxy-D-manno-octulosonic-acid transferase [Pseudomonas aeruginosa]|nr:3-deoxy-D-manno-octulosonic-acid transferase [Pseudomonas aeruginosa]
MQWNLEQIRLFVSVAERQSFSAAARELKRVQSAVSNGIALLEADLGVTLFERSSGRQPRLTDEGRVLLAEAREVLRQCERLQGRALGLARGEEPRLRLAQDEAMPYQPVLDSLEALAQRFPSLEVQVSSGGQGDVTRRLLEEQADLGLLFHHERMPESLERRRLGSVEMVTVCGAGHPLAGLQRVSRRELAQHRQLLIVPPAERLSGRRADQPAGLAAGQLLFHGRAADAQPRLGLATAARGAVPHLRPADGGADQRLDAAGAGGRTGLAAQRGARPGGGLARRNLHPPPTRHRLSRSAGVLLSCAPMNRTLYTLLFHLGLPLVALRLWWRARQAPAYAKRIGERFSLSLPEVPPGGIWVHAVSVGESIAAAPMVRALLERHPQLPVTVTCMTPTGSERIRALFGEQVRHCYLPYDLPWAAARFLDRVRPRLAVIMETELWPNHIHACAVRGIPVALANARLSERSARGYARFAGLTRPMLAELSWVAVQTEAEAERFRRLGARPECVSVTGSIKFDLRIDPQLPLAAAALREEWDATARPLWIAASTHAGEDEIVLAAHRRLLETRPDALLILVPRHPERFAGVHELCRREGFATVRRSGGEPVARATQVLLGDTMGELLFLYALADIAFVGGSLVPNGGHNLLEPAALGKPVFAGPHLFNFLDIAAQLRDAGALLEVTDAGELCDGLARLWAQPEVATAMATAGEKVLRNNQGALERLLAGLARLLGRGG